MFYLDKTLTMQKLLLTLLTTITLSSQIFSQENAIKSYPLKDYIAPDIKYKTLDLGSWIWFQGSDNLNDFYSNLNLHYYEYLNTKNHQGITNAMLLTSFNFNNDDFNSATHLESNINLGYFSQNRFYNKTKTFWGIHGGINYEFEPKVRKSSDPDNLDIHDQSHQFLFTPYISLGKGRIEPIKSARQAMDILISLKRYNRLSIEPNQAMIDSLARVVNRITFKRFYDSRFKRIYQLKELDKAIQSMNLVDTLDMIYFANLNDIWNYARKYQRGSGIRFEGGLIPIISIEYKKINNPNAPIVTKDMDNNYGIYGFVSFNRMNPVSYTWQSDMMIDLTFGYENAIEKMESDANPEIDRTENSYFKAMLNASWQFGYYPNTRTFAGITPFMSFSLTEQIDGSKSNIGGANTGILFDAYYYISPKLRLSFDAGLFYGDNFDSSVPTPFWNVVSYSEFSRELSRTNNLFVQQPRLPVNVYDGLYYTFRFALTFAIF